MGLTELALLTSLSVFQQANVTAQDLHGKYGVDPALVLAIVQVESGFNPKAIGPSKERGLMQLHPKYFPKAKLDIKGNMETGVAYLAKLKKLCGHYKEAWFVCYNVGPNRPLYKPKRFLYYVKVMKEYRRLKIPTYLAAQ